MGHSGFEHAQLDVLAPLSEKVSSSIEVEYRFPLRFEKKKVPVEIPDVHDYKQKEKNDCIFS